MANFVDAMYEIVSPCCKNNAISKKNDEGKTAKQYNDKNEEDDDDGIIPPPLIIILDCSLVLSIDSSAGQAIVKLKNSLLKQYNIDMCIFVTGSVDGFPT